jgi:serine/threonine protein kinase/WD40 repeat protein
MSAESVKAHEIFLRCAEIESEAERRRFLDHECRDDVILRQQVESLLELSEKLGRFAAQPGDTVENPPIPTFRRMHDGPGQHVGSYKLLQQIGEGGFGIVYMAEQERPVRRLVALKIIKPGMDTAQVVARFESERQALALMDHPNIAKVLDVGATDFGRPFFVMELVKGVPITEFCDKNRLSAHARLDLFIHVCQAIQHAHHKGIIHRDIKPSNVMVTLHDGTPVPKVIDFGVAKAVVQKLTERTLFTAYGQMIGTPAYMSPEQAEMSGLDIDTRSDVYSLGVLLYELLTGTTPLDNKRLRSAGYSEIQRMIQDEEPPRPSSRLSSLGGDATILAGHRGTDVIRLVQLLKGDLDWIVMKCLEKDRTRRYPTPAELADDIGRYLRHEAITARPASALYTLRKFARRHRAAVSGVATVATALVLGTAVATWQAVRATRAETSVRQALDQVEHARQAEVEQRNLAEKNEQKALEAERARRHELVQVYLAETKSALLTGGFAERQAGTAAVRGALASVPWTELSEQQQRDLVNAAIPCLLSAELQEISRLPLPIFPHQNHLREIDVDPAFQWVALPTNVTPDTVLVPLAGGTSPRKFTAPEQQPRSSPSYRLFSPRGQWLMEVSYTYSAGARQRLVVWNVKSGDVIFDRSHDGVTETPVFHPDEQHLLLPDPTAREFGLFNLATREEIAASPRRFFSPRAAYSADGEYLAIASPLPAEIVDADTWETLVTIAEIGKAVSVAWHPLESWAALGTAEGQVCRCQIDSRVQPLGRKHSDAVNLLVFSPDGRLLASNDASNRFAVRRLQDNHILASGTGAVLRFSFDGSQLAVVDANQLIVYQIQKSSLYRQVLAVSDAAEFSSDGRWLGVSGVGGARLYDAATLELVADLGLDHSGPVAFHPGGNYLTTFGYFSQAWTWPLTKNTLGPPRPVVPRSTFSLGLRPQHQGRHAVWSRDGRWLAVADFRDDKILLWDATSNSAREFVSARKPVQVAMSPDGQFLAASLWGESRTVVWNTTDKRQVLNTDGRTGIAFSDDGNWFAKRAMTSVEIYNVQGWDLRHSIQVQATLDQQRLPPVFQPKGSLIAVTDLAHQVHLYDRETGRPVAILNDRLATPVTWLSFSPDGMRLAVTRPERISVWNLAELRDELTELGLTGNGLPTAQSRPATDQIDLTQQLIVDRGRLPSQWYTQWRLLARYEAAIGNVPDAIDNMNNACEQVPADDPAAKAALLAERGHLFRRNLSLQSAIADWQNALELMPEQPSAAFALAHVFVLGPPELRDPRRALPLCSIASLDRDSQATVQLLLAMARVRSARSEPSDRDLLQSATTGKLKVERPAYQVLAGYFLALDHIATREIPRAEELLEETIRLQEQLNNSLRLDERVELDRLQSEVTAALGVLSQP